MMRSTNRRRNGKSALRRGFTLIELLVVIIIITLLLAFLVVLIKGMIDKARYAKTAGLIKTLDMACQTYHKDFFVYPPQPPSDSSSLHKHLGANRILKLSHKRTNVTSNAPTPSQTKPPIMEFRADQLNLGDTRTDTSPNPPVEVIDAWGQTLLYANPGIVNEKAVDLASAGRDGIFETNPTVTQTDDVNNWIKDY